MSQEKNLELMVALKLVSSIERVFANTSQRMLRWSIRLENLGNIFKALQAYLLTAQSPSLQQWVNRLVEYIDTRYLFFAYQKFLYLIESGYEPEIAFQKVIGT